MKSILLILLCSIAVGNAQIGGGFGGGAVPSGGAPSGGAPTGGAPTGGAPTGGAPTGGSPAGGLPGGGSPGGGLPTGGGGLPTGGLPTGPGADICGVFTTVPNPLLGGELIKGACSMAQNWLKGVQQALPAPPQFRLILTPAQRAYWDRVVTCRSIQCLCDYWPRCKQFTDEVNSGKRQANVTEILYYAQRYGTSTRKDIRAFSDVERRRFFYALNKLKYDKIDGWSKFDILTGYHFFVPFTPAAHFSAAMLPFHREQIKNLEIGLRMEHPLAAFPYWDSSLDAELNNPRDTVMWTGELLGGGDGNVTDGPFSTWQGEANSAFPAPLYQGGIFRAAGLSQKGVLINKQYIELIMQFPNMQSLVFCTNPFLDTIHAGVHIYIGGLMADPSSSPGEPLFYLHHGFIDYIWEQWRRKHQDRKQRESDVALPCPYNPFDFGEIQLFPYPIKVKDAYANIYTDEFYNYQEQPTCANKCHDSRFLVCNQKTGRCMSRVKVNGDCSGLDFDPCYKSTCQGGKCVAPKQ